ncbi:hypothetical protein DFQ28_002620 [Apophysomyces sp. BC1034]|nr:hypothetical protein DFQ30_005034 [Apophysomyces sp. BC1015]KAG0180780.1 hypothetical protein DFQ29_010164 [Apophysomyces sp. BC1021]KAG0190016.1 hypothetical protein DFQ28_002620 [Apophysomyces sp. BC1034]
MLMQELQICSCVCRSWYYAFAAVLKRAKVFIRTRDQLRAFLHQAQSHLPRIDQIREIQLSCDVDLNTQDLQQIQCACPLVEVFQFRRDHICGHRAEHPEFYEVFADWSRLRRIPVVWCYSDEAFHYLQGEGRHLEQFKLSWHQGLFGQTHRHLLLEKLSRFSCLKDLQLFGSSCEKLLVLEIMDELHNTAPLLESICLDCIHPDDGRTGTSYVRPTTIATNMRSFTLIGHTCGSLWFDYIAHKYQQLRALNIRLGWDVLSYDVDDYKQGLLKIATNLQHLERFHFNISALITPLFLETLDEMGISLTDFSTEVVLWRNSFTNPYQAIRMLLSHHVTSLRIIMEHNPIDLLRPLAACTHLTYLDLDGINNDLSINIILDSNPALQELRMKGHIFAESNIHNGLRPHGLEKIVICDGWFIGTQFFEHLSIRCRDLKVIELRTCRRLISKTKKPPRIALDFSQQTLESVEVDVMWLTMNSTLDPFNEISTKNNMSLFSLTEISKESEERWYHAYDSNIGSGERDCLKSEATNKKLRLLSGQEIQAIRAYEMTSADWDRAITPQICFQKVEDWEQDICYGYFSLRCKTVDSYVVSDIVVV